MWEALGGPAFGVWIRSRVRARDWADFFAWRVTKFGVLKARTKVSLIQTSVSIRKGGKLEEEKTQV